jgi:hypothetical protein
MWSSLCLLIYSMLLLFRIVFWVLPCKIIIGRRFRGTWCLHHPWWWRQHIPEDNSELHTRRRENLKSHDVIVVIWVRTSTLIRLPTLKCFLLWVYPKPWPSDLSQSMQRCAPPLNVRTVSSQRASHSLIPLHYCAGTYLRRNNLPVKT